MWWCLQPLEVCTPQNNVSAHFVYDCSFACCVLCSIKSWALISGLVLLTISCNVHSLFRSMPFCRFQLKLHIVYFFVCMPTLVNLLISRCLQFEHVYMVLLFESNERLALNSFSCGHKYCKQIEEFRITSRLRLQPLPVFYHCVQVHSSKFKVKSLFLDVHHILLVHFRFSCNLGNFLGLLKSSRSLPRSCIVASYSFFFFFLEPVCSTPLPPP